MNQQQNYDVFVFGGHGKSASIVEGSDRLLLTKNPACSFRVAPVARALILLLQWCHNDLPVVGQWSISDFTMVNLFV